MLTRIADGVSVHTSECLETNSIVVDDGAAALVIDPGLTNAELIDLAANVRALGLEVVAGFATHPDWDHALWHPSLGEAPRYGTARAAAVLDALRGDPDWRAHVTEGLPPEIAHDVPLDLFGMLIGLPAGASTVPWDGPLTRILEHQGHAQGHAALLIEERRVLVAGDMLSDVLVPMPDLDGDAPDPLQDYLDGLQLLEQAALDADFVVPGHGSPGDAGELRARIVADRAYVEGLRDGGMISDPRITEPKAGWEWVLYVHEGNVERAARARSDRRKGPDSAPSGANG
ncbi:MBL fold metallo-hydrolase [Microbacterium sp. B2969]|uniref:MBL fold metallo-hydrolase n=1 Tax=Microbacterium alkaliflavum TaxID=3248839 RepID=A0ABW7Q3B6_9MICO